MKNTGFLFGILCFFFGISFAQPTDWQTLAHRIPDMTETRLHRLQLHWDVEIHEGNILKMRHKQTGLEQYVDITNRQFNFENLPENVQVIDLINADTAAYSHLYTHTHTLPVAGTAGYPLLIGDFNQNNRLDFAGSHFTVNDTGTIDAAIVELSDDTSFTLRKRYDHQEIPIGLTDLNRDGLPELNFKQRKVMNNVIHSDPNGYPDSLNTSLCMWRVLGGGIGYERFLDLDQDGNLDMVHLGADEKEPWGTKFYVSEYDTSSNQFVQKFSIRPPTFAVSPFNIDDFDNDGFIEVTMGSIFGDVFVIENTGNDSYALSFTDTLSITSAYLSTRTNDIDGNGKPEFFIGGNGYYNGIGAARVYWLEADGDNHYQKVRSFYLLGANILGFYRLYNYDINADQIDDLVFFFEYFALILTWNPDGYFDLFFYLNWFDLPHLSIRSMNVYDVFNAGKPNLLINLINVHSPDNKYLSFLYRNNFLTALPAEPTPKLPAAFSLHQNYPNPFNGATQINFSIDKTVFINLSIYDINGKEVANLLKNQRYSPGKYDIQWNGLNINGKEVSSGIYFYELKTDRFRQVRKMLYVK